MKRHVAGLGLVEPTQNASLVGLFLVTVVRAFWGGPPQKPFLALRFRIEEPSAHAGDTFSGRLYGTPKALWKLNWFLREFDYDSDLLGREEIDEKALCKLRGVIRASQARVNGRMYLNLDGFASAGKWEELSISSGAPARIAEDLVDL